MTDSTTPLTLVHTADWQIGMQAAHAGGRAADVREARFVTAERVVALANERGADLLVLAGDTFEHNAVPRAEVQRVVDILSRAKMPVLVIAGNHDPLVPGSVWMHPAWAETGNVTVADGPGPHDLGGAHVFAAPLRAKNGTNDPTDVFPDAPAGQDPSRIRIGVAHGALRDAGAPADRMEDAFPIDRAVVGRAGLDYLALGDWHSTSIHEVDGVARVAYSATHETTKFGERDSGNALVVRIAGPGAVPEIETVATGVLTWHDRQERVESAEDLERLRGEIGDAGDEARERELIRLRLSGTLDVTSLARLGDLADLLQERYLAVVMETGDVVPSMEGTDWIGQLPAGVPQAVARRLLAAAESGQAPSTHRRALELLHELAMAAEARP